MKRAKFARDRVRKHFGRRFGVDMELVKQSLSLAKEIGQENRQAARQIWSLMRPHMKMWGAGTVILMLTETSWGFWYGALMTIPNMVSNPTRETVCMLGTLGYFCQPAACPAAVQQMLKVLP
eukprot:SAG31_NODE_5893_length_2270_cov_1.878858_2_plen_122_part_00